VYSTRVSSRFFWSSIASCAATDGSFAFSAEVAAAGGMADWVTWTALLSVKQTNVNASFHPSFGKKL
jgi:hypothetical protein